MLVMQNSEDTALPDGDAAGRGVLEVRLLVLEVRLLECVHRDCARCHLDAVAERLPSRSASRASSRLPHIDVRWETKSGETRTTAIVAENVMDVPERRPRVEDAGGGGADRGAIVDVGALRPCSIRGPLVMGG